MNYKFSAEQAREVVNAGQSLIFEGRILSVIDAVLILKDERKSHFERLRNCQLEIQGILKKHNADLFGQVDMTGQDVSTIIHQFANNPNKPVDIKPPIKIGVALK